MEKSVTITAPRTEGQVTAVGIRTPGTVRPRLSSHMVKPMKTGFLHQGKVQPKTQEVPQTQGSRAAELEPCSSCPALLTLRLRTSAEYKGKRIFILFLLVHLME